MILDLIYDIYFGISYGNSRIYFYYSDHIMKFLDLIFMIFYFTIQINYDIFGSDFMIFYFYIL